MGIDIVILRTSTSLGVTTHNYVTHIIRKQLYTKKYFECDCNLSLLCEQWKIVLSVQFDVDNIVKAKRFSYLSFMSKEKTTISRLGKENNFCEKSF